MKSILYALSIIFQMETANCDLNAIGDNGKAFGVLQIHKECLIDVNRIYSCDYTIQDLFSESASEDIFIKYCTYWGNHYEKQTGKKANKYIIARIWNGGAYGWKKESTNNYINKFKKLEK